MSSRRWANVSYLDAIRPEPAWRTDYAFLASYSADLVAMVAALLALADQRMSDDSGLVPWWVCKDGTVKRYVFNVPTSEQRHWLHWMKEQRLLYRLALGQPNQEDLIEILSSKAGLEPAAVRQAVVNLSPWFRRRT